MKKIMLLFMTVFIMSSFAQDFTLKTYGVSPRDAALSTTDIFDRAYNGLQNVGTETKVFLVVTSSKRALINPKWEFVSVPAGSAVAFGNTWNKDTSKQVISFVPDITGTYVVKIIDDASSATITINAAKFLGVEGGAIAGGCGRCHSTQKTQWASTGHKSALDKGFDGLKGASFKSTCVSCHSTGHDALAKNDGFDDFNFVFPAKLEVGMSDTIKKKYPDAMKRSGIQCESCHGPAGNHYGFTTDAKISTSYSADVCALCHDSGTHHVYPAQWDVSGHANTVSSPTGAGRNGCVRCHTGKGFVQYSKGVPEASMDVTYNPISCVACHDPHDATKPNQLRKYATVLANGETITAGGKGQLCFNCHQARRNSATYTADFKNLSSTYGPHYSNQADMLMNKNIVNYGKAFNSTNHFDALENACVDCHMYPGHVDENKQVVLSGSHSFKMSTPDGVDNMAACAKCHGYSLGSSFSKIQFYYKGTTDLDKDGVEEGLQTEVKGLAEQLAMLLPPVGKPTVSVTRADSTKLGKAGAIAVYNYKWVTEDGSYGIHNPKLTIDILYASIQAMGGVVAVDEDENTELPKQFELKQNYPNPFNPTTTIEFSIPAATQVSVKIYDLLGKEVATLFNGNKPAGKYKVNWNANGAASGIYFYKIETPNYTQTKKMVLMK